VQSDLVHRLFILHGSIRNATEPGVGVMPGMRATLCFEGHIPRTGAQSPQRMTLRQTRTEAKLLSEMGLIRNQNSANSGLEAVPPAQDDAPSISVDATRT
jgi:hypothetical protein